jgi:hypothetical protein
VPACPAGIRACHLLRHCGQVRRPLWSGEHQDCIALPASISCVEGGVLQFLRRSRSSWRKARGLVCRVLTSKLPGGSLKTLLCDIVSIQNNMCLVKKLAKSCHKLSLLGACSTTAISWFVCLHGAGVNADKAVECPRATGMERRGKLWGRDMFTIVPRWRVVQHCEAGILLLSPRYFTIASLCSTDIV